MNLPDLSTLSDIRFDQPAWLWALGLIPLLAAWYIWAFRSGRPKLVLPPAAFVAEAGSSLRKRLFHVLPVLRILAFTALVIAMARPQTSSSREDVNIEGIDIVMAMDVSTSMLAADFKPDRITVARDVGSQFVTGRKDDRIGLVLFAGEAFTQCPLTTDHHVLKNLLTDVRTGLIEDGTAIGDGLATAINRLKDSEAVSKVIILLTDGANNRGRIAPRDAADIAHEMGIRIYTIGIGSQGLVPYPVETPFGRQYQQVEVPLDEALLKDIAEATGGDYFKASSRQKLESIYAEIDRMEKTRIDVSIYSRKHEEFLPFLLLALGLILLEALLRYLVFKTTP